jgi:hypothetical protein
VTIEHNDGRFKASAKLLLEHPELLDEWPDSRQNAYIKNKEVKAHRLIIHNTYNKRLVDTTRSGS